MTQRGHIVDFDEARASSSRYAQNRSSSQRQRYSNTSSSHSSRRAEGYRSSYGDAQPRYTSAGHTSRSSGRDDFSQVASYARKLSTASTGSPYGRTNSTTMGSRANIPLWLAEAQAELSETKSQLAGATGSNVAPSRARSPQGRATFDARGVDEGISSATPRDWWMPNDRRSGLGARRFDNPDTLGSDRFGQMGADWVGPNRSSSNRFDPDRSGSNRLGSNSLGSDRFSYGRPTTSGRTMREDNPYAHGTRYDNYNSAPRAAVFDEQSLHDENEPEAEAHQGFFSKLKSRKRAATKERASRKFDREFADAPTSGPNDGAPRAALTRGEMGTHQRYANRLQQSATSSGGSFAGMTSGNGGRYDVPDARTDHAPRIKRMSHPVLKIGAAALALIICAGAFMYPTVQTYYQTMREHDRLEAEYEAVNNRNEALQESINDLQSDDGVAAYAHEQYGWVKSGEQSAFVSGLDIDSKDGLENVYTNVQLSTIKAPETWYSPVLDKVFGVDSE